MIKNIGSRYIKDEAGGWWYILSKNKNNKTRAVIGTCLYCGEKYLTIPSREKRGGKQGRFCSRSCGSKALGGHRGRIGEKNHRWKGGRNVATSGYVEIYAPDHPKAKGGKYVLEHRLVMEKTLGRYLQPHERVHHRNGIKTDNRPENLVLVTEQIHFGEVTCPHCNKSFAIK